MDWDTVIWLILGILGAALIVGGIIAYRGSVSTSVRAFSGAAIAAGVVMSRVPGSGVTRVEGLDEERPPRHP